MKDYSMIIAGLSATGLTRVERHKRIAEIEAEFRADLEALYAPSATKAQRDILYNKAYADSHAYGYSEIAGHYCDLVEFMHRYEKAGRTRADS
jgi:hypothetical protein